MKLQKPIPVDSLNLKFIEIMNDIEEKLKSSTINNLYARLLNTILTEGDVIETRNHSCYSYISGLQVTFDSLPLVTVRKTAWKKALLEMEWFLSGDPTCPDKLKDWWEGQLNTDGEYCRGYGDQLTNYTSTDSTGMVLGFDQIYHIIDAIKYHPNSRRLLSTTWHPEEMSVITKINGNSNTPTTCHGSLTQYFVRNDKLYLSTYQRSADMLLGVPHNWVQYWAYLMWLAHRTGYEVGGITWTFGDAHIYNHLTHTDTARDIISNADRIRDKSKMIYTPTSAAFKASDFSIEGVIPEPVVLTKPKLF